MGRRILVTGLATFWGGRVAEALETDDGVDVIVGVDTRDPVADLKRTEFVRADLGFSVLSRVIDATQVDTVVHAQVVVDSTRMRDREMHETNVIGTMNLLAAAGGPGSAVRCVVVKSSTLVYGSTERDPYWFREEHERSRPARTRVERSLLEAESYVREFVEDNPGVDTAVLRFADALGPDLATPLSRLLTKPVVPAIAGFDPLLQFVEETDGVEALRFAVDRRLRGVFNVAGEGRVPWSECASVAGKRLAPVLPPYLTERVGGALGALRLIDLPPDLLALLRHGRGVDNRRLRDAGFRYAYTSAGAVERLAHAARRRRVTEATSDGGRGDPDVEHFLRHSPALARPPEV